MTDADLWERLERAELLLERVQEDENAIAGRRTSARAAVVDALSALDDRLNGGGS